MSLLQIHEPGQTPAPHHDEAAIGIDLGTTHSVIAMAEKGQVQVLQDLCGGALIPSVVRYTASGKPLVGREAVAASAQGASLIKSVKRLMGRDRGEAAKLGHFVLADSAAGELLLETPQGPKSPVEISADILRHLKHTAEQALGKPVTQAVITVPAYFDDAARAQTRQAAQLAGLEVLRLVNEPTAAALAYGLDNQAEGVYAIYDLGGGTFDISLLRLEGGVFQVLATGGDLALGGDDFDHLLDNHVSHHSPSHAALNPQIRLAAMRKAKEQLSEAESVTVAGVTLTRTIFEQAIEPLIRRTLNLCQLALDDAGLAVEDIKGVVLVGGSTRIPLLRQRVETFFGKAPLTNVNPDEVVAVGAALQAEGLTRGSDNLLLDVTPLSLGLETMGGIVEKIIHRNTPIPTRVAQEFTTYQDGQTAMLIHVLQGEREMVDQCRSLAKFTLKGIPPLPAGIARIEVTFSVDADGLLSVSALEKQTGAIQTVEVRPSYGLPPEKIEAMLLESMEHARADITQRLLAEARMEAGRLLEELKSALKTSGDIATEEEKSLFDKRIHILQQAMQTENRDSIDVARIALEQASRDFAERRMDSAIQNALKGSKIDEVET
jgi:molecular chaperone HscA